MRPDHIPFDRIQGKILFRIVQRGFRVSETVKSLSSGDGLSFVPVVEKKVVEKRAARQRDDVRFPFLRPDQIDDETDFERMFQHARIAVMDECVQFSEFGMKKDVFDDEKIVFDKRPVDHFVSSDLIRIDYILRAATLQTNRRNWYFLTPGSLFLYIKCF